VENVFDALCTCVQVPRGKTMFLELEGVELCLLFLRGEGKVAKQRGLKVLDFAVGGVGGDAIAEKLIDAGGLKALFGMFMKKVFIPLNPPFRQMLTLCFSQTTKRQNI